jgi:hypothetical protein
MSRYNLRTYTVPNADVSDLYISDSSEELAGNKKNYIFSSEASSDYDSSSSSSSGSNKRASVSVSSKGKTKPPPSDWSVGD